MDNFYRENILDHYRNPRNFGKMKSPDSGGEDANISCGDKIGIQIKLQNKDKTIEDIRFYGEGCAISMASASLLTGKVKGMKVEEVKKLVTKDVLILLGFELTPTRLKCALLSLEVLQRVIANIPLAKTR